MIFLKKPAAVLFKSSGCTTCAGGLNLFSCPLLKSWQEKYTEVFIEVISFKFVSYIAKFVFSLSFEIRLCAERIRRESSTVSRHA